MPWNSSFAKHLVLAESQGFVTSDEYAAIRELLTRDEPWRKLEDQSVDWDKPREPGPVKIVPQSEQRALAERDERVYGIGFLIDGKHVDPSRVVVLNSKLRGATDSVEEIIRDLVDLAHGEGIADPIIERGRAYLETLK